MTILQILPIIISCIALTVSILSFKYKKNSGKIDKAIELANIYRSLIKDISEFSKIIDTHKHIHELIFKINIDKENLFTYEELNKFYSETDIKDLNSFFNGNGMDPVILQSIYIQNKINNGELSSFIIHKNNNDKGNKLEYERISDAYICSYYHFRFVDFLNKLEYFAMAFVQNVADDDVVYSSLHQTYFAIIRYFYFLIVFRNRSTESKYYTNITELYKKWMEKDLKNKNKIKRIFKIKKRI